MGVDLMLIGARYSIISLIFFIPYVSFAQFSPSRTIMQRELTRISPDMFFSSPRRPSSFAKSGLRSSCLPSLLAGESSCCVLGS